MRCSLRPLRIVGSNTSRRMLIRLSQVPVHRVFSFGVLAWMASGWRMGVRTVSWQISMRRSNGISSTCHRESGLRMRIITARRIISGELLKERYGL